MVLVLVKLLPLRKSHLSTQGLAINNPFENFRSVLSYYCCLIAITIFYLIASFNSELPWGKCEETWENCIDSIPEGEVFPPGENERRMSSSEFYFLRNVIKQKDDISDGIGTPDWRLTLCLLGAWIMIFLIIVRGVRSSGKAAYFLALFPYVVLFTLLIRAVTLDGAVDGIIFFFKPQWGELLNPKASKFLLALNIFYKDFILALHACITK